MLFVTARLAACALVLTGLMLVLRRSWRPLARGKWVHCAIAGALMNAGGLMPPHVGMLTAPAAQVALVQTLAPLLTAILGVVLLHEGLRPRQWAGLALGVAGVGLVVGQAALQSPARFQGLVLAFAGVVCLVAGTLHFGRYCRGVALLPGATVQFISAAAVASVATLVLEHIHAEWNATAVAATAWNTVMVSLGGMGLYFGMLVRGTAARASANFYLVPGTAALLTWAALGERLSPLAVVGLVVASGGCWLVNAAPRERGGVPVPLAAAPGRPMNETGDTPA